MKLSSSTDPNNTNTTNDEYIREMEKNCELFKKKIKNIKQNQERCSISLYNDNINHCDMEIYNDSLERKPKKRQSNNVSTLNNSKEYPISGKPSINDNQIIDQLQNEINYKDNIISRLQAQWSILDNKILASNYTTKDIETMQSDLNTKYNENTYLKEENENWKMIIHNLKAENVCYKETTNKQLNLIDHLKIQNAKCVDDTKSMRKLVSDHEIEGRKHRREYDQVTKHLNKMWKENIGLKGDVEEVKAKNYNWEQELSECKKQWQVMIRKCTLKERWNNVNEQNNATVKRDGNYWNGNVGYDITNQHNQTNEMWTKNEDKRTCLAMWIRDKIFLENQLFKIPDNPRTLPEIKKKKEINKRIEDLDAKIKELKGEINAVNN